MAAPISQKEKEVVKAVRNNLELLMTIHGLTLETFCNYIKNKGELSQHRSTFSRFMHGNLPRPNLAFLLSCCHAFELSLDNLVSQDFNPYENYQKTKEKYKEIFSQTPIDNIPRPNYWPKEIFVEDPNSSLFKNYMQTYFCYYFSTVSTENNSDNVQDSLISGELSFNACNNKCKATLKIDTKKTDKDGNPQFKFYSGDVILCPSIQSVHCILTLPEGEFCFIIFRYSHLNLSMQECRLAEVLSTSSIPDKRYPIVHRMLLSQKEIRKEDWAVIAPHLCMNSSEILISREELLTLTKVSDHYNQIVQDIFQNESKQMYFITEKTTKDVAKKHLTSEELPKFITDLRTHSFSKRYNKVSTKADEEVRMALLDKGYFQ